MVKATFHYLYLLLNPILYNSVQCSLSSIIFYVLFSVEGCLCIAWGYHHMWPSKPGEEWLSLSSDGSDQVSYRESRTT